MYSYPNLIPLPANKVRDMAEKVKDIQFSRLYNAFHGVVEDANKAVQRSADRYIKGPARRTISYVIACISSLHLYN